MNPVNPASASGSRSDREASPSSAAADDPLAQRFREMMDAPLPGEGKVPVALDGMQRGASAPASLGDAILSAISNATDSISSSWVQVEGGGALGKEGTSLEAGALLLYAEKMRIWSLQTEIVSKGISKATQDLDQLLKPQ